MSHHRRVGAGSARWIANEVLNHASVESCNGTQPTILTDLICRHFNITEFQQLIPRVYSGIEPAGRLAGLSHFIAASDLIEQPFWLSILRRAGGRLAKLCVPLLAKLGPGNRPGVVHVSGSVLANNEPVREAFKAELTAKVKRTIAIESPVLSAAHGAALMAMEKVAPTNVRDIAARLAKRES